MNLWIATKAIVEYRGKALILRESATYEEGNHAGKYDLPGGRIKADEFLPDAARREIKEESGLEVEVGNVFHIAEKIADIKDEPWHIVRIYFSCKALSKDVTLSDDHDHYEWIDPREHAHWNLIESEHGTFEQYLALCT